MSDKKTSSKKTQTALTKEDLISYIGPMFEDLTHRIDSKTDRLEKMIKGETNRLEVILDSDKREVLTALETHFASTPSSEIVDNHEDRIQNLEHDETVLKAVSKR